MRDIDTERMGKPWMEYIPKLIECTKYVNEGEGAKEHLGERIPGLGEQLEEKGRRKTLWENIGFSAKDESDCLQYAIGLTQVKHQLI